MTELRAAEVAPQEEVVFGNTVEALFVKALGSRLTPPFIEELAREGIDLKKKLKPYYPRPLYYRCVHIAAQQLFPGLGTEQAMFQLGRSFMMGFEETILGRAMLGVVRMMGPQRTLKRMTQNFRSSNNYMQTEIRELAPNSAELTLSQTSGVPSYFEGVLDYGLTAAGAKQLRIERIDEDGARATLRFTWAAK